MNRCLNCDMIKFCPPRLSDETITGCTLKDYLEGRIPGEGIQVEHTIYLEDDSKRRAESI